MVAHIGEFLISFQRNLFEIQTFEREHLDPYNRVLGLAARKLVMENDVQK
jgi:hypothetical protein